MPALLSRATAVRPVAQQKVQKPQAKPQVNAVKATVAAVAAAAMLAAPVLPVFAAEDLKGIICPANPTAKICLKDSAK